MVDLSKMIEEKSEFEIILQNLKESIIIVSKEVDSKTTLNS